MSPSRTPTAATNTDLSRPDHAGPRDGGPIRLPQIVGLGHAMEIILSGERFDAEHAYRIGLVNRIFAQAAPLQKNDGLRANAGQARATVAPVRQEGDAPIDGHDV